MGLQPVYLVSVGNLGRLLDALRRAQAPDKFTLRFLEDLGFKSTNDRLFIPLLKAMRMLDDSAKPTSRYHSFLDDTQWKQVLADGIRDAYPDLFRVNRDAQKLTREQLTGKIKSLAEGKLSPAVVANTARTFMALVKMADFASSPESVPKPSPPTEDHTAELRPLPELETPLAEREHLATSAHSLVYRIEIVLPAVRDQAIYDAIFRSAKEHLLR